MAEETENGTATKSDQIRKFCLTMALILITFVLADIAIGQKVEIKPYDLPLEIRRTDLLPVGIAIACFVSMLRFIYYGLLLGISPYRKRLNILRRWNLLLEGQGVYLFRPYEIRNVGEIEIDAFNNTIAGAFPRFLGAKAGVKFKTKNGKTTSYFVIPRRVKVATFFEDIDYFAPIWLSLFALGLFGYSLMTKPRVETPSASEGIRVKSCYPLPTKFGMNAIPSKFERLCSYSM